jgi:hypothetical protein
VKDIVEQVICLCIFCKQVGIPFEVYAFSDNSIPVRKFSTLHQANGLAKPGAFKTNDMFISAFSLINFLSSKMPKREFQKRAGEIFNIACAMSKGHNTKDAALPKRTVSTVPSILAMNGTPLDEAIVALYDLVPKFQKANNIQIVNTMILTDGEGYSGMTRGKYNSAGKISSMNSHLVISNPKTKTNTDMTTCNLNFTGFLVQELKEATGCNTIGYYLVGDANSAKYWIESHSGKNDNTKKIVADLNTNCCARISSYGYDAYFVLNAGAINGGHSTLDFGNNTNLDASGATKILVDNAMKNKSRKVFLSNFISIISKNFTETDKKMVVKKSR